MIILVSVISAVGNPPKQFKTFQLGKESKEWNNDEQDTVSPPTQNFSKIVRYGNETLLARNARQNDLFEELIIYLAVAITIILHHQEVQVQAQACVLCRMDPESTQLRMLIAYINRL